MLYTGAIKNLFGIIPGGLKPELHFNYKNTNMFAEMIVDIYDLIRPQFSLIDGITAMEGNGPSAGTPRAVNCLILSENALTADICGAKIIGYSINDIPILKSAAMRGLGPVSIDEINIIGEKISGFIINDFKKNPGISPMVPKIIRCLEKFILSKPVVNHKKCIKCKHCIEICHGKFVALKNNKIVYDYKNCIRCYCCQEVCPVGAISIHKPILMNYIDKILELL